MYEVISQYIKYLIKVIHPRVWKLTVWIKFGIIHIEVILSQVPTQISNMEYVAFIERFLHTCDSQ